MLNSLKDAVDGWRQAKTLRHLIEISAGVRTNDVSDAAPLTDAERHYALTITDTFITTYLAKLDTNRAFAAGAIMYCQFSPRYRQASPRMLANIQYKTAHHIV